MNNVFNVIKADIFRWCDYNNRSHSLSSWLCYFLCPQHRKLIAFRCYCGGGIWRILQKVLNLSAPFCDFILPYGANFQTFGPGLLIMHGFSTIINCKKMGNNCTIYQQVTIGATAKGTPVIGDDCIIYSGCKILGNIIIGDDVIVGANAVVVKDIPSHSVVVGVPAKIIKRRDCKNSKWLSVKDENII